MEVLEPLSHEDMRIWFVPKSPAATLLWRLRRWLLPKPQEQKAFKLDRTCKPCLTTFEKLSKSITVPRLRSKRATLSHSKTYALTRMTLLSWAEWVALRKVGRALKSGMIGLLRNLLATMIASRKAKSFLSWLRLKWLTRLKLNAAQYAWQQVAKFGSSP